MKTRYVKSVVFNSINDITSIDERVNKAVDELTVKGNKVVSIIANVPLPTLSNTALPFEPCFATWRFLTTRSESMVLPVVSRGHQTRVAAGKMNGAPA